VASLPPREHHFQSGCCLKWASFTSEARSMYFCFSFPSREYHHSPRILLTVLLSLLGCLWWTMARCLLEKIMKAFMGLLILGREDFLSDRLVPSRPDSPAFPLDDLLPHPSPPTVLCCCTFSPNPPGRRIDRPLGCLLLQSLLLTTRLLFDSPVGKTSSSSSSSRPDWSESVKLGESIQIISLEDSDAW